MILDTNGLSALADGNARVREALRSAAGISLPVIVLGEYFFGIKQSRNRQRYEKWLESMVRDSRVLHIDLETAGVYAEIRSELKSRGRPIPMNDIWIAALCRQHSEAVLSQDAHFDAVPKLRRISW